jgi:hypothetical protein
VNRSHPGAVSIARRLEVYIELLVERIILTLALEQ